MLCFLKMKLTNNKVRNNNIISFIFFYIHHKLFTSRIFFRKFNNLHHIIKYIFTR